MKRFQTTLLAMLCAITMAAQGWPSQYGGVMLQGFYWDSYGESNWSVLESQADELADYFSLVWLPQSADCGGTSMGYDDMYWFPGHYNSTFGTESELRSLIKTFKQKGIGTIADVVVNHRKSNNGWFGFPSETYKGVTYTMGAGDVCSDDDNGKAKAEADRLGVTLGNKDTGEGWDGMRDLDHKSTNVQNTVKAYVKMLIDDMGYAGFRYDMVKGYSGSYTALYNNYAKPQFSVGECWDGTGTIRNWIDATDKTSAAFDFQFRYTVRNAINAGDWTQLGKENGSGNWPLVSSSYSNGNYRRYAVTFVENHDTEKRSNAAQDPIKKDTLAANAYLLAMPGTPCVFLTHWRDCKQAIKAMIDVRRAAGIHNESTYTGFASNKDYYAVCTKGTSGQLLCVVGSKVSGYTPSHNYVRVLSGHHFAYYLHKEMNTAWADLASGEYATAQKVTLTAVSTDDAAKLVYTTDGSNPTASSKQVASGTTIDLPMGTEMTLKVGLLTGGSVKNVVTRQYVVKEPEEPVVSIPDFCSRSAGEVCAFFEAPLTWTLDVCCWAWTNSPADNFTYAERKNWPGTTCTLLGKADNGNKVWKWTWDGKKQNNSAATQPAYIIFSNSGSPQTADFDFTNGGYYTLDGLFDVVPVGTSGIDTVTQPSAPFGQPAGIYNLAGQRMATTNLPQGIYIVNGKKMIKK